MKHIKITNKSTYIIIICACVMVTSCIQYIYLPTNKNIDLSIVSLPQKSKKMNLLFKSHTIETALTPYFKDKFKRNREGIRWEHDEKVVLNEMFQSYIGNRYQAGNEATLEVFIKDFWLEMYNPLSPYSERAMLIGEGRYFTIEPHLIVEVSLSIEGHSKTIRFEESSPYSANSINLQSQYAEAIDNLNNKIILKTDHWLSEQSY